MLDTETSIPRTAPARSVPEKLPDPTWARHITDNVTDGWANMMTIVDAQVSIWSMKFLRVLILAALAVPLGLAGVALVIYGFTLLDRCLDIVLSAPGYAPWLSSLVRGGLYFGVPFTGLLITLFVAVGGPSESDDEAGMAGTENPHA